MNTDQIVKQTVLNAPLERVWRALTDSKQFGSWFGLKIDGPFRAGASVHAEIARTTVNAEIAAAQKEFEGFPFEILIEDMVPERLFSFRWHPYAIEPGKNYSSEPTTLVTFTLEPEQSGVKLTVTESGFDQIPLERRAKAFSANEQGWAIQMTLIEAYLAQSK